MCLCIQTFVSYTQKLCKYKVFIFFFIFCNIFSSQIPQIFAAASLATKELSEFQVDYTNGLLSVSVRDSSLRLILEEISSQSDVTVRYSNDTDKLVTAEFLNLPLETGIKRLVGNVGMAFVEDDSGGVVLQDVTIVSSLNKRITVLEDESELQTLLNNPLIANKDKLESAYGLIRSHPSTAAIIIKKSIESSMDKNISYSLVSMLGRQEDQAATEVLGELALENSNPTIRYKAIQALGKSDDFKHRKIDFLKKSAQRDPDRFNRARAIISLGTLDRNGTEEFIASLYSSENDLFVRNVCEIQLSNLRKNY